MQVGVWSACGQSWTICMRRCSSPNARVGRVSSVRAPPTEAELSHGPKLTHRLDHDQNVLHTADSACTMISCPYRCGVCRSSSSAGRGHTARRFGRHCHACLGRNKGAVCKTVSLMQGTCGRPDVIRCRIQPYINQGGAAGPAPAPGLALGPAWRKPGHTGRTAGDQDGSYATQTGAANGRLSRSRLSSTRSSRHGGPPVRRMRSATPIIDPRPLTRDLGACGSG
jgi:hypothetical protein